MVTAALSEEYLFTLDPASPCAPGSKADSKSHHPAPRAKSAARTARKASLPDLFDRDENALTAHSSGRKVTGMSLDKSWDVPPVAKTCAVTGREFSDEEAVHSVLVRNRAALERRDLSQEGWEKEQQKMEPVSHWKTGFKPAAAPKQETLPKENAIQLLRRLVEEPSGASKNIPYILAVMLERKRTLRHKETVQEGDITMMVYENARTGEVFRVEDPKLSLNELEAVQQELADLLNADAAAHANAQPVAPGTAQQPELPTSAPAVATQEVSVEPEQQEQVTAEPAQEAVAAESVEENSSEQPIEDEVAEQDADEEIVIVAGPEDFEAADDAQA